MHLPKQLLRRLTDATLMRYVLASALALGFDMGTFLVALRAGVPAAAAAALGYSTGIVAHWLISSRAVFAQGVAARGAQRTWQKAMFVGSALLGLALTTAIVGTGAALGSDPQVSKLVAIVISFTVNWQLRARVVFRLESAR